MKIEIMLIGLVVLAIGAALTVGVITQSGTPGNMTTGIVPIEMPTEIFGFPAIAIGGVLALVGVGVTILGFNMF